MHWLVGDLTVWFIMDPNHLYLILIFLETAVALQCWQEPTYSEAVVAPALGSSSSILRVPKALSLAACARACCDLPGCDLAWLFEQHCYALSCQQRENCQPRSRPGADSFLAFLQRGAPQTLMLQSLVRGQPYPGRWRPRPSGDIEALKDLALFDGTQTGFGDPGRLEFEYPESELGTEDNGEDLPDWPALWEGNDGINQSESGGRIEGLGFTTEGSENSLTSTSAEAIINQNHTFSDPTFSDPTSDTAPENKQDSGLQSTSLTPSVSTHETLNDRVDSSQPSQIRTSLANDGQSYLTRESPLTTPIQTAQRSNQTSTAMTPPVTQVVPPIASYGITNNSHVPGDGVMVRHHMEQVGGPSTERSSFEVLNLSSLVMREDSFRLPVTGYDGLSDSTTATSMVPQPEETYSTPTHGHKPLMVASSPGPPATPLHRQGDQTFVTSSVVASVKTDEKSPSLAAVKESNGAPVAVVGSHMQLTLPVASVTLDGSHSTDDHLITSYHWNTVSGPPGSRIEGVDRAVAIATGLRAGRYKFQLTVSDQEGVTDSALLIVRVQEARSAPPVAHASGSHTLTLPNNSLVLWGSVTEGDPTKMHFLWVRDSQSPAAGDVLYNSDQQASLYLANLVMGTYVYQLRVTDAQGRSSTATATVEVRPDPGGGEEVEVEMWVAVAQVSISQRDTVLRQLAALLHILDKDIHFRGLWGRSGISTVLRFSVQGSEGPVSGSELAGVLRGHLLREKTDYLLFRVLRVDTVMCLLRCSGRGTCDPITKSCVCDPFWMENLIRRFFGDGESNCEWRLLYFFLVSIMMFALTVTVTWACVYCCKRRRRTKVRKKTKYTILDNMDEQERMELRPKYNIKHKSTEHNSSLMMSESELDSEQDTIFSRDPPVRSRNRTGAQAVRNGNAFG
ncbi:hypothetical protein DPEC_G00352520 [Dallia pectoralis]|uniref:Uncharacterized protein n=1 Tax=Dallia pectoralis TaxID=75939 RepID=A0ACC2F2M3_DALPE|nr:hypothetical protein DPEC_G00352520 [Dallia pectoralis]